jgi:hypothetical protein
MSISFRTSRLRRAALAALVTLLSIASPWAASSMASNGGGADKARPATFGDCKHANSGVHNGYDCEEAEPPAPGGTPG